METGILFHEQILVEILLRLPVKALIRFKCVCRTWRDFIGSPFFIDMHLNRFERDEYMLIYGFNAAEGKGYFSLHSNDSLAVLDSDLKVSSFTSSLYVQFTASCNGIVCLTDWDDIGLYNPALGEFTILPQPPFGCPLGVHQIAEGVGFGYDPTTKDYKAIRIVTFIPEDWDDHSIDFDWESKKVEIYNLSSNSWREIGGIKLDDSDISICIACHPCFALSFNGSFHWFLMNKELWQIHGILGFQISNELFQQISIPYDCSDPQQMQSLFVIDESLAFIFRTEYEYFPTSLEFFQIWVMTEYGVANSWAMKYHIGPVSGIRRPISVSLWKNDFLLLEGVVFEQLRTRADDDFVPPESQNGQLVSYHVRNNQQSRYGIKGHEHTLRAINYKESLVSIRRILEQNASSSDDDEDDEIGSD